MGPNRARIVAATNTPNGGKAGPNRACVVIRATGRAAGNTGPNRAYVVAAAKTPNGGKAGHNGACVGTGAAGNVGTPIGACLTPCDAAVGKSVDQPSRSLLQPQQLARDLLPLDVFGQLHESASHSVPVDCSNDWTQEAIMMAIQARPSLTALMPEVT
jgi:hypothetical protein